MKGGGLVLWNVTAICEMSKTSLQKGKLSMKDDLDNQTKGQKFLLEQWLNIIRISERDQSRLHQFGKTVLPGIFLGYELIAERLWKGHILVADTEELEKLGASEIYPPRINAKEILIRQKDDEFIFPVADGTAKLSGRDYMGKHSMKDDLEKHSKDLLEQWLSIVRFHREIKQKFINLARKYHLEPFLAMSQSRRKFGKEIF